VPHHEAFEMPIDNQRYLARLMIQDAFIVLTPAILLLVGVLLFYWEDWVPWCLTK
jgi:hypothetical protein